MVSDKQHSSDLGFGGAYEPVVRRGPVEVRPKPPSTSILKVKPWLIVAGALLAGTLVFGFLKLLSGAGQQVAAHNQQVVGQIDHAKDADAEVTAQSALLAAKSIFASDASYSGVDPVSLAQTEPSFHYTTGPSTGSKVVSVSATANQVGIAVSSGKSCWYLVDNGTGATKYGSGTGACTGAAALRLATSPAW